ncbi:MAG: virulence factor SrfB [Opitutales bacterium]|nr:virulence factor SrfB [Opitutales bacterium]
MSKNDKPVPYQVAVFPNSGHQYFNIPLKDLLPDQDEAFLEKLALNNNNLSWKKWSAYVPWVIYRYEIREGVPTLRLCIETNLGTTKRGLLFEVKDSKAPPPDDSDAISPYACEDEMQIEADYKNRLLPLKKLPNSENREINIGLQIYWKPRSGMDPVDVDLIVDLGNTRTVALLLESPRPDNPSNELNGRVKILRFIPRGMPYERGDQGGSNAVLMDDCAIIDSWMLLHRTQFHDMEPPKSEEKICTHYDAVVDKEGNIAGHREKSILPHSFVELSPAIIGGGRSSPEGARRIYSMCRLDSDARFYLGSPKRYVWDDELQGTKGGTFWKQIPNETDSDITPDYYCELKGLFRYFMDTGGKDWDIDNPPKDDEFDSLPFPKSEATYPRRDAVCWFALSILEAAHRQINSPLNAMGESLPRRLRNIRITYPAGWTGEERRRFFAQWQRAINLFTMTRFENHAPVCLTTDRRGGSRPVLSDSPIDEAVCSQLPIIYSDVKTLMGDGESWLRLYGDGESVTVMNIDIGGGTTDMAIIRYSMANGGTRRGGGTALKTKLIFRDGCAIAGDMLVKKIIEKVLLPAWIESSGLAQYEGIPDARRWVSNFLAKPSNAEFTPVDHRASMKLARIVRLVFVPLVNQWLSQLVNASENAGSGWEKLSIGDALARNIIDNQALKDLNELVSRVIRMKCEAGKLWEGTVFSAERNIYIQCDRSAIESCVDEVFGSLFEHLAQLAGRFDCQLAIVSGKPSELPRIREMLANCFPLLPQRIIHMKNFPAGGWYPFSTFTDGRIVDAKTCTVVGAALYQDICNGNLPGLSIREESQDRPQCQYYWSILPANGFYDEDGPEYLFTPADYPSPERDEISCPPQRFEVALPCRIGRQIVPVAGVMPDPVYEIRYKPDYESTTPFDHVFVTLKWSSRVGDGEKLELVRVDKHPDWPDVDTDAIEMRLNTMLEKSHWLDDPGFVIN